MGAFIGSINATVERTLKRLGICRVEYGNSGKPGCGELMDGQHGEAEPRRWTRRRRGSSPCKFNADGKLRPRP